MRTVKVQLMGAETVRKFVDVVSMDVREGVLTVTIGPPSVPKTVLYPLLRVAWAEEETDRL
jgi:hypothetical protein